MFFKITVLKWKRNTFGSIFDKKRKILARLEGIQNSPKYPFSNFLCNLEESLIVEYNDILKLEEDYWKLRSRVNWLNDDDANTRFFHIKTTSRRRRNNIVYFKDDNRNWLDDQNAITTHTINFFAKLFTTSHDNLNWSYIKNDTPNFHTIDLSSLDKPLRNHEIRKAVFSFKPYKVQVRMGYTLSFFWKYWHIVGSKVINLCHNVFQTKKSPQT